MIQTLLIALLIIGAVGVLLNAWWTGRQSRDPASSVATFHRAMTAMERTAPHQDPPIRIGEPASDHDGEELTRT